MTPPIVVTGTGTGIGKTHVACALIGALRDAGADALGWKPVESGVTDAVGDDERALASASFPAVAPKTLRLREAIAPNVAARHDGVAIDPIALRRQLIEVCACRTVVVELAGGLFSPFDDRCDNADWVTGLGARVVLVAPNRLGVLHDVGAVLRAARAIPLAISHILLTAQEVRDASGASNAAELTARHPTHHLVEVARMPIANLRTSPTFVSLAKGFLSF